MDKTENGRQLTEDYQNYLDQIRSFHLIGGPRMDWMEIRNRKAPYDPGKEIGSAEEALMEKKPDATDAQLAQARREDCIEYRSYEELRMIHDALYDGKIETYLELITLMHPYDALIPWGMYLSCGTDPNGCFEVRCNMGEENLLPVVEQNFTPTGKLSKKKLTKTARMELWKEIAASVVLFIAKRTFELLPLGEMTVVLVNQNESGAAQVYLRARVSRGEIMGKDPGHADLLATLDGFRNCTMKFQKTAGFQPIERSGKGGLS